MFFYTEWVQLLFLLFKSFVDVNGLTLIKWLFNHQRIVFYCVFSDVPTQVRALVERMKNDSVCLKIFDL